MAFQPLLNSVTSSPCPYLGTSHTGLPLASGRHQASASGTLHEPNCVGKYIPNHSFFILCILVSVGYVFIMLLKAGAPLKQYRKIPGLQGLPFMVEKKNNKKGNKI